MGLRIWFRKSVYILFNVLQRLCYSYRFAGLYQAIKRKDGFAQPNTGFQL